MDRSSTPTPVVWKIAFASTGNIASMGTSPNPFVPNGPSYNLYSTNFISIFCGQSCDVCM
jgi:hypothetical protein